MNIRAALALVVGPGLLTIGIPSASAATNEPKGTMGFAASVDVSVVDLAVVVRDGKGRPVTGLKPESFRIRSGGIDLEITNFSEVRSGAARAPRPAAEAVSVAAPPTPVAPTAEPAVENRLVVFFDNLHLHPGSRDRAVGHVRDVVLELMAPGTTEAMVVTFQRRLEIVQRLTRDTSSLTRALDEVKGRSGGAGEAASSRERLREALNEQVGDIGPSVRAANTTEGAEYQQALTLVENYARSEEHDLRRSLAGLAAAIDLLAGVEGRKAILVVSDSLALSPGEDAFAFLDQVFTNANARMKALDFDRTREFKDVTTRANAHGVSLYVLGTARPAFRGIVGADRSRPVNPKFRGLTLDDYGQTAMERAADILADDTGGLAMVGASDLARSLARVKEDFESYYSVGFRPSGAPDHLQDLSVDLVGQERGLQVRFRRGYTQFSAEKSLEQAVLSALELPREENPLAIQGTMEPVRRLGNGDIALVIRLAIPWRSLVLNEVGELLQGGIVARLAFQDENGETSGVRTLAQAIELPVKYRAAAERESYTYTIDLTLRPGPWTVAVAVTDVFSRSTSFLRFHRSVGK